MHSDFKIGIEDESAASITIYNTIVIKIERFSKMMHFILMKVTLSAFMVPSITVTYLKYYALGLGDASFSESPHVYGIL